MRLGSYKVDPDKCEGIRQNGRIKQNAPEARSARTTPAHLNYAIHAATRYGLDTEVYSQDVSPKLLTSMRFDSSLVTTNTNSTRIE